MYYNMNNFLQAISFYWLTHHYRLKTLILLLRENHFYIPLLVLTVKLGSTQLKKKTLFIRDPVWPELYAQDWPENANNEGDLHFLFQATLPSIDHPKMVTPESHANALGIINAQMHK